MIAITDPEVAACEGCGELVDRAEAAAMDAEEYGTLYFCEDCDPDRNEEDAP